jgi:acyl carrier protein
MGKRYWGLSENKISLYDDFFRLGGNSILAIKLSSKLNEKLATKISFADLLKYQTIDKLALYITCNTENIYDPSYSVVDEGEL